MTRPRILRGSNPPVTCKCDMTHTHNGCRYYHTVFHFLLYEWFIIVTTDFIYNLIHLVLASNCTVVRLEYDHINAC